MTYNISIKRWNETDWVAFKALRLEAIRAHPSVFLDDADREAHEGESYWRAKFLPPDKTAIFAAYDEDSPVAMAGIFPLRQDPDHSMMIGMCYVRDTYRGRGLSHALYTSCIASAKACHGMQRIIVSHRENNHASQAAIIKAGFQLVEIHEKSYGDGSHGISYRYELTW